MKTKPESVSSSCTCVFGQRRFPSRAPDDSGTRNSETDLVIQGQLHTLPYSPFPTSPPDRYPANSPLLTTLARSSIAPAPGLEGRRSLPTWWRRTGLNRRPPACKAGALPLSYAPGSMVGQGGLEPPTSRLSSARSNQLSY